MWASYSGVHFLGFFFFLVVGQGGLQFGSKLHESGSYRMAVDCTGLAPAQRKPASHCAVGRYFVI